jgi:hypothetical protein
MNITIITKENIMKRADIKVGDHLAWHGWGSTWQVVVIDTDGWKKTDAKTDFQFHLDGESRTLSVPGVPQSGSASVLVAIVIHSDTWTEENIKVVPLRQLLGDWAPVGERIRLGREAQLRSYREADERFRQERGW